MLLQVEDLADEGDGGAGGDGSDGVEGGGEAAEVAAADGAAQVQDGDHGEDEREAGERTEIVPVRGDEEDDAAGEEDGSEDEGDEALPAEAGGLFLFGFESAHAGDEACIALSIEDSGGLPAC